MAITRNGTRKKRVLDPRFAMPPGVEDFYYEDVLFDEDDDDDEDEGDDEAQAETPAKKKKKKKKNKKKKKKNKGKKGKKKGKSGIAKAGKGKNKGKKKSQKDNPGGKVNTPKTFEIVKQTIRTKKDGSQVVDLTVDVQKIGRADKYEFRVVKKDNGKVQVISG